MYRRVCVGMYITLQRIFTARVGARAVFFSFCSSTLFFCQLSFFRFFVFFFFVYTDLRTSCVALLVRYRQSYTPPKVDRFLLLLLF